MRKILFLILIYANISFAQITQNNDWHKTGNTLSLDSIYFIGSINNTPVIIKVNNIQMIKIDKNGHMSLGLNTSTLNIGAACFRIGGLMTGGGTGTGLFIQPLIAGDVTTSQRMLFIQPSFTTTSAVTGPYLGVSSAAPSVGTNSPTSVTYYDSGADIANATGLQICMQGRINVGSQRWNFYSAGTAPSWFQGLCVNSSTFTPGAKIHIGAGAATASTSPLKFTSGTNNTTAETGAMEFSSNTLFFTPNTTRYEVAVMLKGSGTLDFPSTAAGTSSDLTIAVTGAALNDPVYPGVPNGSTLANGVFTAWVSAANTVTVRFTNTNLVTALDPASGTFKVTVNKN